MGPGSAGRAQSVGRRGPSPLLAPVNLRQGVAKANVPTLVAVLVHLTGDHRWMSQDYQIARPRGVSDNDTGGLELERQDEIRAAALEALQSPLRRRQGGDLKLGRRSAG
jgi:4-hydroxyacetophenone monooxygenase